MKKFMANLRMFFVTDKFFTVGLLLFIMCILIANFIQMDRIMSLVLFLISYVLIGHNILHSTLRNIAKGRIFDENFLMTIASVGAFILGFYTEAVGVMLFYKIGEFFQEMASDSATRSIEAMLDMSVETASVQVGDNLVSMDPKQVEVGSHVVVAPGGKIPIDGIIVKGSSDINTAALTGEFSPRFAGEGDEVLAGFINGSNLIVVKTTKTFDNTVFAKVINMVKESHAQKASTEKFITRFARYYTPAVVLLAAFVAVLPPLFIADAMFSTWVYRALIFLVISCPCALLISVPLSFFAGIGASAKKGIFVKGGQYLEALAHIDTIVFDKTGTLTTGEFGVYAVDAYSAYTRDEVLRFAALAEQYSTHPVGRCIVKAYNDKNPDKPLPIEYLEYKEMSGRGVMASIEEHTIVVGKVGYIKEYITALEVDTLGNHLIYVALNNRLIGSIHVGDKVRDNAEDTIRQLREYGVSRIHLLSGDYENAVKKVADTLKLDGYKAELLPGDKLDTLVAMIKNQPKNKKIAFVGDGINDAPSLARADVGIAIGGVSSDAALEASDIVLTEDNIGRIPLAMHIARKTRAIAYQNIVGAIGIKIMIMVLGTIGYTALWMAIFADVGVALLAVLNALRVLNVKDSTLSQENAAVVCHGV